MHALTVQPGLADFIALEDAPPRPCDIKVALDFTV
jgi:hypothetical protein